MVERVSLSSLWRRFIAAPGCRGGRGTEDAVSYSTRQVGRRGRRRLDCLRSIERVRSLTKHPGAGGAYRRDPGGYRLGGLWAVGVHLRRGDVWIALHDRT